MVKIIITVFNFNHLILNERLTLKTTCNCVHLLQRQIRIPYSRGENHINDFVRVFESDDRFNYILIDLHPPKNSSGIELVYKWLTFPDMGHIVATYYNKLVVELTNHEIGTSEKKNSQLEGYATA